MPAPTKTFGSTWTFRESIEAAAGPELRAVRDERRRALARDSGPSFVRSFAGSSTCWRRFGTRCEALTRSPRSRRRSPPLTDRSRRRSTSAPEPEPRRSRSPSVSRGSRRRRRHRAGDGRARAAEDARPRQPLVRGRGRIRASVWRRVVRPRHGREHDPFLRRARAPRASGRNPRRRVLAWSADADLRLT